MIVFDGEITVIYVTIFGGEWIVASGEGERCIMRRRLFRSEVQYPKE
jgi:hypothetical protein